MRGVFDECCSVSAGEFSAPRHEGKQFREHVPFCARFGGRERSGSL
jgi:hypothetical protein